MGGDYFCSFFLECKKVLCGGGGGCEDTMPVFITHAHVIHYKEPGRRKGTDKRN